jgi:ribosomal protein S8
MPEKDLYANLSAPARRIMRMIARREEQHDKEMQENVKGIVTPLHTVSSLAEEYPRIKKREKGPRRERNTGVSYQFVYRITEFLKDEGYASVWEEVDSEERKHTYFRIGGRFNPRTKVIPPKGRKTYRSSRRRESQKTYAEKSPPSRKKRVTVCNKPPKSR